MEWKNKICKFRLKEIQKAIKFLSIVIGNWHRNSKFLVSGLMLNFVDFDFYKYCIFRLSQIDAMLTKFRRVLNSY